MKKTQNDTNRFKVPDWFRRISSGALFGRRKDDLILKILKLGGKELLISQCGLPLNSDSIDAVPAPSMKLLLAVLRKAESERRDVDRAAAKGESMTADPKNFHIKRTILMDGEGGFCETEFWTRKNK